MHELLFIGQLRWRALIVVSKIAHLSIYNSVAQTITRYEVLIFLECLLLCSIHTVTASNPLGKVTVDSLLFEKKSLGSTYPFFLNFLRPSLSLSRLAVSLSGSFLERPDLLIPYMSGFSSHSRLDSCLSLCFASVLWFELLLWKLSLCAGASDLSDFSESEPDPEPEPLDELESLR